MIDLILCVGSSQRINQDVKKSYFPRLSLLKTIKMRQETNSVNFLPDQC